MQGQGGVREVERAEQADAATQALAPLRFVMSPGEAVHARLPDIERFEHRVGEQRLALRAALPASYAKSRRRRFPLLVLQGLDALFGSAIEMSRMLAATREVRHSIVVNVEGGPEGDTRLLAAVVAECRRRYRVDPAEVALFSHGDAANGLLTSFGSGIAGVTRCVLASAEIKHAPLRSLPGTYHDSIAWTVLIAPAGQTTGIERIRLKVLPESTADSMVIPALLHGLRTFWGAAHQYGDEVVALSHPLIQRSLRMLSPLLRPLTRRRAFVADTESPQVLRSQAMGRDFEIFIALPESAQRNPGRRYPTLIALDGNGCFATVAETAARLAQAGDIEDVIIVAIGTPRSQGNIEFAFRRFEELSPPPPAGYDFDDMLGRFFRSIYALRGQDARAQLGQAPAFHEFITRELMPQLMSELPIDPNRLSLLGHSAAGTYVAYELAQPKSLFTGYLCLSPGVFISGSWMLHHASSGGRGTAPRLFVSIGAEELSNRFNAIAGIPQTPAWVESLRKNGGPKVHCHVLDGETHSTVFPRALAQGLRELLSFERKAGQ